MFKFHRGYFFNCPGLRTVCRRQKAQLTSNQTGKMRTIHRVLVMAALFVAFFILLKMRLYDIWDQYNVQAYLSASLGFEVEAHFEHPPLGKAGDKVVVMAKMEEENTDWVGENLPEYVIDLRHLFLPLLTCLHY